MAGNESGGEHGPDATAATQLPDLAIAETASQDAAHAPTAAGSMPSAPAGERLSPGDTAGDYRIIRWLGGGAMGDVYEGEAEAIGKRVAIKVIKHVLATSPDAAERFLREARAVNRIDHPNVLDVFAFGQLDDGRLYLVMDRLRGMSLGERLRDHGALDEREFLEVFAPMCRAVDAAHAAGIIHRDLKPDNVFLAEQAEGTHVYVLDFGIAKLLSDAAAGEGQATLTGEGVWIGTPAYMSPEQWAADPASGRTDIYALGCTAFEMLTGRVPFVADSVPGIMQKHFNDELPELERVDGTGTVRRELGAAIEVAMAKEPADRYASAADFLAALDDRKSGDAPGQRPIPMIAAALALIVLLAGGFVLWQRSAAKEPESGAAASGGETDESIEPRRWWSVTVDAEPRHANIVAAGHGEAVGRLELADLEPDMSVAVHISAPGFIETELVLDSTHAGSKRVVLDPVAGFEGLWKLDDKTFRQLARHEDGVAVFHLATEDAKPQFLQKFRFTDNKDGWVHFEASVMVADARAPKNESCQFHLASEYRFHMSRLALDFRRERVPVGFNRRTQRCTVGTREKGPWEHTERVTTGDDEVVWAVSRAGGGGGLEAYIRSRPIEPLILPAPKPDPTATSKRNDADRKRRLLDKKKKALEAKKNRVGKGKKGNTQDFVDNLGDLGKPTNRANQAVQPKKAPVKKAPVLKKQAPGKGKKRPDAVQQKLPTKK